MQLRIFVFENFNKYFLFTLIKCHFNGSPIIFIFLYIQNIISGMIIKNLKNCNTKSLKCTGIQILNVTFDTIPLDDICEKVITILNLPLTLAATQFQSLSSSPLTERSLANTSIYRWKWNTVYIKRNAWKLYYQRIHRLPMILFAVLAKCWSHFPQG